MSEYSEELIDDKECIISELRSCYEELEKMPDSIEVIIGNVEKAKSYQEFITILNCLLINPNHHSHQYVARLLQEMACPTSIPYIKQVLDSEFAYLEYTCSESEVIAKWFSWILYSIGTKEAIDIIKEYTKSKDIGIRKEMLYRLKKIEKDDCL